MNNKTTKNNYDAALKQYSTARGNLLLMLILTVVNVVLFVVGTDTMLLFSATVPYYSIIFGLVDQTGILLLPGIVIAVLSLGAYFLCWLLSKKNHGWMILALALFIIDTVCLVALYIWAEDFSGILDFAIHVWVLFYLIVGVRTGAQLKRMEENTVVTEDGEAVLNGDTDCAENSSYIRAVDTSVKARVLLEADILGHKVCYRRVKKANELVVDGYVYDEIEMLLETPHCLTAKIDGHIIEAGFNNTSKSYILLDGQEVAKKMRWF